MTTSVNIKESARRATQDRSGQTKAKSRATKVHRRDPLVWPSVANFREQLEDEHKAESGAPEYLGLSPRASLRVPVLETLCQFAEPVDAVTLRKAVCRKTGLDPQSARIINLHAWTLVDMQDAGFITSHAIRSKKLYAVPASVRGIISVIRLLDWHAALEARASKAKLKEAA